MPQPRWGALDMSGGYYVSGAERARKVGDLFRRIARRYDFINDIQSFGLHRLWKRRVARLAGVAPGQKALDVCCGTGDLSMLLASAGAQTIGVDFTPAMLDVARQRLQRLAAKKPRLDLTFCLADALKLPFDDGQFDAVTIGYGLRNLADWREGLREIWRVTKPSGRIVVLDFGKPQNRIWRWLFFQYLQWGVPIYGLLFCGDAAAYAYILESLEHYPAQSGVAEAMRELSCRNVAVHQFFGGVAAINYGVK